MITEHEADCPIVSTGWAATTPRYCTCARVTIARTYGSGAAGTEQKTNYMHTSHSHCWDQNGKPACGIALEQHTQCCLCDLKYPNTIEGIDYSLAKKLKDAGFPQEGIKGESKLQGSAFSNGLEYCYHPILEELIDAIGPQFGSLNRIGNEMWMANEQSLGRFIHAKATTPLVAAAFLYLALQDAKKEIRP